VDGATELAKPRILCSACYDLAKQFHMGGPLVLRIHPYWKLVISLIAILHVALFAVTGSLRAVALLLLATLFSIVWLSAMGFYEINLLDKFRRSKRP